MQQNFGSTFSGGLNNTNDPSEIQTNECQDILNFRILNDGSALKRTGYSKLLASAESNPIIAQKQVTIGASKYDVYATKDSIKVKSGTVGTTLLSGLNGIDYAMFHQWNDKLFFANGIDNIKKCRLSEGQTVAYIDSTTGNTVIKDIYGDTISNGTLGYIPLKLVSNSNYLYTLDSTGKLHQLTSNLTQVAQVTSSITTVVDMCCNSSYIFLVGNDSGTGKIEEYDAQTLALVASHAAGSSVFYSCACDISRLVVAYVLGGYYNQLLSFDMNLSVKTSENLGSISVVSSKMAIMGNTSSVISTINPSIPFPICLAVSPTIYTLQIPDSGLSSIGPNISVSNTISSISGSNRNMMTVSDSTKNYDIIEFIIPVPSTILILVNTSTIPES